MLASAAVAVLILFDRMGLRLGAGGPLLLLVVYASATSGTTGGLLATIPCLMYTVYDVFGRRDGGGGDVTGMAPLLAFAGCAVALSIVVGRATSRGRRAAGEPLNEERTKGRMQLAQSEQLNRVVLDSLPAHVAVLDAQGRIVVTNKAWRQFQANNGGTASTCDTGSNYLAVCRSATGEGADLAAKVGAGIESVLRGEREQFTTEYPCHSPHEKRWFLLAATPLASTGAGGVGGAVVTHLDITERKLSEVSIRERAAELAAMTRALKKTNEELDQFAYITSHDLRAPLRGIANLSLWIEEDMGDRFTPEAHRQMELLRGRVHRMEAMIDGILEYSRVGRVRVEPEPVDVAALLADVVDLLDPPAQMTVEVAPGMPVVLGHKLRLQQVFLNLVGNALKYHDKPAGRIVVGCREADEFYEFFVADDGPGIDPRYHDRIFVIFQTLQARDKVESTGVGLSLVRKIVEAEGGAIRVDSAPGRGSTFHFTWPRSVAPSGSAPAQAPRRPSNLHG